MSASNGKVATVFTHRRSEDTNGALLRLIEVAREHGWTLRFPEGETRKHGLQEGDGLLVNQPIEPDVDLCLVLGGDGTILSALRAYAGTRVPVWSVNFGEIGFLATVEPEDLDFGLERAFTGDFDVMELPGIELSGSLRAREGRLAINDVALQRRHGARVAQLAYSVGDDEVGSVRCDGLAVATPAGSTGYNLANGGPVLAWGVKGYVVSFIAPHSLTARALVVAPDDVLRLANHSRDEPVDVSVDGRPLCDMRPGDEIELRFRDGVGCLAQLPGASFYHRMREKFGRLAS